MTQMLRSSSADLSYLLTILWSNVIASNHFTGSGNASTLFSPVSRQCARAGLLAMHTSQFGSFGKCVNKLCRHVMHETRLIFPRFFSVLIGIGFLDHDRDTSALPPVSLTSTAEFSRVVADASGSASLSLHTSVEADPQIHWFRHELGPWL